ncbi:MAG TPA: pyrimidine dimer DNA glycosylase/endonuclease V [Bacteroidota bacterium]|nr:pyrimidine dimer DNA glycosylase/endonuclease V [Bacteroidota bacterium]
MRLWSLHPRYLDAKGLVALWREALLARKVLRGATKGYRHHPQLIRFNARHPVLPAIDTYLSAIADEAETRGYRFDRRKIGRTLSRRRFEVSEGQLRYELAHLKRKLRRRDPDRYRQLRRLSLPKPHPMFVPVPGPRASWEKVQRESPRI